MYKFVTASTFAIMAMCQGGVSTILAETSPSAAVSEVQSTNRTENYTNYLGPEGLAKLMEQTSSHALTMDLYTLTILKMNIQVKDLLLLPAYQDFANKIQQHQQTAKEHADDWDEVHRKINHINQNIIRYNTIFQNRYDGLLHAIDTQDDDTFRETIGELIGKISGYTLKADTLLEELKEYRKKIVTDADSLKDDHQYAMAHVTNTQATKSSFEKMLTDRQKQIDDLQKNTPNQLKEALSIAATLGGAMATGSASPTTTISGLYSLGKFLQNVREEDHVMQAATMEMSKIDGQIGLLHIATTNLNIVGNTTKYIGDTMNEAILTLANTSREWTSIKQNLESVNKKYLQKIKPEDRAFLKADLKSAKKRWEDLSNYAKKINELNMKELDPNQHETR